MLGDRGGEPPDGTDLLRRSVLGRGGTPEQAIGAQILVDLRPVYAIARTGLFPDRTLRGRSGQQPRVPGEGHRDAAAIHEIDDEIVRVAADIGDTLVGDPSRNIHATPSATSRGAFPPTRVSH